MAKDSDDRIIGICHNGHIVTAGYGSNELREQGIIPAGDLKKFCPVCGKPIILGCTHCHALILLETTYNVDLDQMYILPNHCYNCGQAYPWMEAKIKAAQELADELQHLTKAEKEALKGTIPDLVSETPRTHVAAIKFKRLANKAGSEGLDIFKDVLTGVLVETAKKLLFP